MGPVAVGLVAVGLVRGVRVGARIVVVVVVVVVPPSVSGVLRAVRVGLCAVPCLVDIGESEDDVAVGRRRRRPQDCGAVRIVAFEARPAQAVRGVLVVEQVDETVGWIGWAGCRVSSG